ncbi:MAG: hypothetical protein ACJAYY_001344 [Paraglaciecola sp.]|jgi:hypothetical protein|uniref:DUF6686 family protein n=1 Tax=Polaribacter sp. TaxID=1920175 RepID=UPI003AC78F89
MCQNSKIISSVKNGEISFCKGCKTYALTYNNIFFQFTIEQLKKFKSYVSQIDIAYWLDHNACATQKRKVPIPTSHQNLILIFDLYEIQELRILLGLDKKNSKKIVGSEDIDYPFILN